MTVKTGCDVSVCLQYKEQQMLKLVRAVLGFTEWWRRCRLGFCWSNFWWWNVGLAIVIASIFIRDYFLQLLIFCV